MPVPSPDILPKKPILPPLAPVSLGKLHAQLRAGRLVVPPPQLVVDCAGIVIPHPLGVGHFVAQLLQLRQRGACIWLANVHPVLLGCLHQMGLGAVFHLSR